MIMALLDSLKSLINEHVAAAGLLQQVAILEREFAILEKKLLVCEVARDKLETENKNLQAEITILKGKVKTGPKVCPVCGEEKGKFFNAVKDPAFGVLGVYIHHYKCEGCGHEYEKEYKR